MYINGKGVLKDHKQAMKWHEEATYQDYAKAGIR